ncbi:MAG: hypothetical protein J7L08_04035 [Candidatus Aenigmarchaeota archaeon]|nr:hypothetical protein [Candidatus Aenigmarchaeota archaeon]
MYTIKDLENLNPLAVEEVQDKDKNNNEDKKETDVKGLTKDEQDEIYSDAFKKYIEAAKYTPDYANYNNTEESLRRQKNLANLTRGLGVLASAFYANKGYQVPKFEENTAYREKENRLRELYRQHINDLNAVRNINLRNKIGAINAAQRAKEQAIKQDQFDRSLAEQKIRDEDLSKYREKTLENQRARTLNYGKAIDDRIEKEKLKREAAEEKAKLKGSVKVKYNDEDVIIPHNDIDNTYKKMVETLGNSINKYKDNKAKASFFKTDKFGNKVIDYRYCAAHKKDFIKNFYDDYMRELQLEKNREYNAKLFQSTLNQKPSKKKEKQTEIPSWFK